MGGTKIFVVQLKEIIKSAALALIGLIIIILLIYFFIPKDKSADKNTLRYIPGTYSSEIILNNNPVLVEVGVSENEILSVGLKNMDMVQETFYPLFKPSMETLSKEIIQNQDLNVTLSQDRAVTEEILLTAVKAALQKAELAVNTK